MPRPELRPGLSCCPPRPEEGKGQLLAQGHLTSAPLTPCRPDQVSVLDSYYYDDGCESCGTDTFSREPAIVKFSSPNTSKRRCVWPESLWNVGWSRPGAGIPH